MHIFKKEPAVAEEIFIEEEDEEEKEETLPGKGDNPILLLVFNHISCTKAPLYLGLLIVIAQASLWREKNFK